MSSLVAFTVPEETKKQINTLARQTGKPEKVVMREVFETGLKSYTLTPTKSVQAALDLIEWAEKNDIISNPVDHRCFELEGGHQ